MMRLILVVLSVLSSFLSGAQTAYRFRNYTINDGLSQSSITCIVQDKNHSLWIGTQDGLNRFDGKNFEVFTSDDTEGLESEYIKSSVKTNDGKLWFGTMNGLTVFDPNTEKFSTYSLSNNKALQ
ncbi:MAG: two-component regulator propeller domain-containing protein, partial [Flavobacteriales bacterium]